MAGLSVDLGEVEWHSWQDPVRGEISGVKWTNVFAEAAPVVGMVEIVPGDALPNHHHTPVEVYHVISGTGEVEIAGEVRPLREGATAYVPSDLWHETRNTGQTPLRILYFFPDARFEDVDYHFE